MMNKKKIKNNIRIIDICSEVTKEKCNGCKWLIEFGAVEEAGCLNSRACINYNEWEEKLNKDEKVTRRIKKVHCHCNS